MASSSGPAPTTGAATGGATGATLRPPGATEWLRALNKELPEMSSGDRATLRRWGLARTYAVDAVVVKLASKIKLPPARYERDFDRWRLVMHVAAMLSGTGKVPPHVETRRLGSALHEVDYSENRLLRLLAARGDALGDQVRRAARMLAPKRLGVNLLTLYDLVGDDAARAEAARIRVARDYYAAEAKRDEGDASDD